MRENNIIQSETLAKASIIIGRVKSKEEFARVCVLLEECTKETSRYIQPAELKDIAREFKNLYQLPNGEPNPNYDVFIAIDKNNNDRVVGFVTGEITQPRYKAQKIYQVETVYVEKLYRGSSAMIFLMRAIFKRADKNKMFSLVNVFPQDKNKLPTLAKRYAESDTADYVTFYRKPKRRTRSKNVNV